MRQVHLFIATSLDGFIAGPEGQIDWLFSDQDYGYSAFWSQVDTVVMGRHTYEQSLQFGPYPYEGRQAYVFTRRGGLPPRPDVTFVGGDALGLVDRLRRQPGGEIWLVGGGGLVAELLEADLIDLWTLSIHPIMLGRGMPLVARATPTRRLTLVDTQRFDSGLVQMRYRRA